MDVVMGWQRGWTDGMGGWVGWTDVVQPAHGVAFDGLFVMMS